MIQVDEMWVFLVASFSLDASSHVMLGSLNDGDFTCTQPVFFGNSYSLGFKQPERTRSIFEFLT